MAFYLKYRPQKIADLDVVQAREALYGLLKSGNIPHALLFTGVRGTGKTSSARIFAKALNCEKNGLVKGGKVSKKENVEPCNECDSCLAITSGSSLDVIEIDAASHRGIDDIRDLREKVKMSPVQSRHKVYIIDEVHMLTTEAFNALLKTLEEPPAHVMFVLCTTEVHKLPETVRSRCHTVAFAKATDEEVAQALSRVVKGEKLDITDEAVGEIARLAQGSFRDATKLLEELSWHEGKLDLKTVQSVLRSPGSELDSILLAVKARDSRAIIDWIEQAANAGGDMKQLAQQLISRLHSELLFLIKGESKIFVEQDRQPVMKLIDLLDSYWGRYGVTQIAQLPLELAVLEWLVNDSAPRVVGGPSSSTSRSTSRPVTAQVTASKPTVTKQVISATQTTEVTDGKSNPAIEVMVKKTVVEPAARPAVPAPAPGEIAIDFVEAQWERLMEAIKPRNFSVEALMRAAKPQSIDGDRLIVEVSYPFHFEKIQQDKSRSVVEECLQEVFGLNLKLQCLLKQPTNRQPKVITKVLSEDEILPQRRSSNASAPSVPAKPAQGENGGFRRRVSKQPPVATEEDDELLKFASEIFGK